MEELIKYLEKQLEVKPSDLLLESDDRMILIGQIDLLEQIKRIHIEGYPDDNSE